MRAAMKAVLDGKQVAVLAPTTILADQHFRTFKRRFSAFPVEIEYLPEYARRQGLSGEQPFIGRIFDSYNAPLTDVLDKLIEWRTRYVERAGS